MDQTASRRNFIAKVWVWTHGGIGGICSEHSNKIQELIFHLSIMI
jgi:hypothetical protein